MQKATFTVCVPKNTRKDKIRWLGLNNAGTLAYGLRDYNGDENVKIYRANLCGSVHEIADIEFDNDGFSDDELFYLKRQEIVWLYKVEPEYSEPSIFPLYGIVIFNVEFGQVKRYYANIDGITRLHPCYFMHSVDDMLILLHDFVSSIRLYEIKLNQMAKTFSMQLLAEVETPGHVHSKLKYLVYYRDRLICYYNYSCVRIYKFKSMFWYQKDVSCHCDIPNQSDHIVPIFDGRSFSCMVIGNKIRMLKFDDIIASWMEIYSIANPNVEDGLYPNPWIISGDCQTVCHFWQKERTITKFINVRITVFRWKEFTLKELSLRALWPYARQLFSKLEHLTDHDLCHTLKLLTVLNAYEYFGRKFNSVKNTNL